MTKHEYKVLCEKRMVTSFDSFEKAQDFVRENEKLKLFDYGAYYYIRKVKKGNKNDCKIK